MAKMTFEQIKELAKENGFDIEQVEPKPHKVSRYTWSGSVYGGRDILFIDHDMKLVLTGNTRAIKNDMYTANTTDLPRLRDLKDKKAVFENQGFTILSVNSLPYQALRILERGNIENSSLAELQALAD